MQQIDDTDFEREVLASTEPVLVDFGATWCGPCRALEPTIEAVANEVKGRAKVVKMDIDESPETAKRYGIRGAPTLVVFRDGKEAKRHVGVTSKERVLALVLG
jgi:thioredoxin 1